VPTTTLRYLFDPSSCTICGFHPRQCLPAASIFRSKYPAFRATQDTYEGYLNKWILPRWESYRLPDLKSVQVEQWLKSLTLAPVSKAKIRNIMSAVYSHAIRWEWATRKSHHPRAAERAESVLLFRVVEELSIDENAQAVGSSAVAVKARLFRACVQLKDQLSKHFASGDEHSEFSGQSIRRALNMDFDNLMTSLLQSALR